ncbi:MAG: HEPN domain-containing protein [Candidatus Omnitrophica bacterium]|nr:HEPN domain-containing protein [Candidatus Omnitrophota bacterium]
MQKRELVPQAYIKNKEEALDFFISKLINSEAEKYVGKIYLFGSLNRRKVTPESDVDLLIFCLRNIDYILNIICDLQMETYWQYSESIEPLLYPIEMLRYPNNYFLYRIIKYGKEVYSMNEEELKREEAKNYLILAKEYLEGAKENLKSKRFRITIDAAYNAAELCAKAFLLQVLAETPSSHGGIIGEFSKFFVKTKKVPEEIGRNLNKSLDLRNKARYVYNAEITLNDAQKLIKLAEEMLKLTKDLWEKD